MSPPKMSAYIVTIVITFFGTAPIWGSAEDDSHPQSYLDMVEQMPPMDLLIWAEQNLYYENSGDPSKIHPSTNDLEGFYRAQSRNWFEIESYWVSSKKYQGLESNKMSSKIQRLFIKKDEQSGEIFYRLLIHPSSKKFYSKILEDALPDKTFMATATASERTLFVRDNNTSFFAKVSLDKNLAGTDRKIKNSEVAMSIGTTNVLTDSNEELPNDFHFFPEVFGIYSHSENLGGMIIREIPPQFFTNGMFWLPMFALFSTINNKAPWLLQLISKKGISQTQALDEWIITPFINQWLSLAIEHGITMEPHGQNLLFGINNLGEPNGQWAHRDFGGFNIDFKYRNKLGKPNSNTPFIGSQERTYYSKDHDNQLYESLYIYFSGTILYDIETNQEVWIKNGWINDENIRKGSLEILLKKRIKERLQDQYGIHIDGRFSLLDMDQFVRAARKKYLADLRTCNKALSKW